MSDKNTDIENLESFAIQNSNASPSCKTEKIKQIFWYVFIFALILQYARISVFITDHEMWANQIKYFLNNDRRLFDFHLAYGHPGTTLVGLGCLFHILFKLSYSMSLTLGMSLLIAILTASASVLCYLLQPQSLWWLTTAFILTVSRFYVLATPPTATVMSFIVLLVVATCCISAKNHSVPRRYYFYWGILLGFSAATRLDVTLLVGLPLFLILSFRNGSGAMAMIIIGGGGAFFIADPFLWYMPVQHVTDLLSKFTLHYAVYSSQLLSFFDYIHGIPLSVLAILWFMNDHFRGRTTYQYQSEVLIVFGVITLLAAVLLASSNYQSMRYLYPLLIVWEIYLPLFALQERNGYCHPSGGGRLDGRTVRIVMGFIIPAQLVGYFFMFHV